MNTIYIFFRKMNCIRLYISIRIYSVLCPCFFFSHLLRSVLLHLLFFFVFFFSILFFFFLFWLILLGSLAFCLFSCPTILVSSHALSILSPFLTLRFPFSFPSSSELHFSSCFFLLFSFCPSFPSCLHSCSYVLPCIFVDKNLFTEDLYFICYASQYCLKLLSLFQTLILL